MRGRHIRRAVCCREKGGNVIRDRAVMLQKELNLFDVSYNSNPKILTLFLFQVARFDPTSESASPLQTSPLSHRAADTFSTLFHLTTANLSRQSMAASRYEP